MTTPNRLPEPQATYADLLLAMRRVARRHGYALALHGSMARDLDVVAIPWTARAKPADVLVESLRLAVDGYIVDHGPGRNPSAKPHGRRAWSIVLAGRANLYVDLSVMPLGVVE